MNEIAVRNILPMPSNMFASGGRLDDLMWVTEMSYDGHLVRVTGTIKPDISLKTVPELRRQLTDSYHRIVTILEEAGARFWRYPELSLQGSVSHGPKPEVYDMKADIKIELYH